MTEGLGTLHILGALPTVIVLLAVFRNAGTTALVPMRSMSAGQDRQILPPGRSCRPEARPDR